MQVALLLNASQTAGVTHWKLIEEDIMPDPGLESTPSSSSGEGRGEAMGAPSKPESLYDVNQFSSTDPEFALLVRYSATARGTGGGSPNRGGAGYGSFRRQGAVVHSNSCFSPSGSAEEDEGSGGEGGGGGGGEGGRCGGQRKSEAAAVGSVSRQPRNPDGSGPM